KGGFFISIQKINYLKIQAGKLLHQFYLPTGIDSCFTCRYILGHQQDALTTMKVTLLKIKP
ncbi:hypothetical protein HMPREF9539_01826, partial [Escherichia coli MS 110-3]